MLLVLVPEPLDACDGTLIKVEPTNVWRLDIIFLMSVHVWVTFCNVEVGIWKMCGVAGGLLGLRASPSLHATMPTTATSRA